MPKLQDLAKLQKAAKKRAKKAVARPNKMHAKRVTIDGIVFASLAEGNRYLDLSLLRHHHMIENLECHPCYQLIINGTLIGHYTADFRYWKDGEQIIEDVKGQMTEAASLRIRVAQAVHGITVKLLTKKTDPRLWK
jgi:hypothetical protein